MAQACCLNYNIHGDRTRPIYTLQLGHAVAILMDVLIYKLIAFSNITRKKLKSSDHGL